MFERVRTNWLVAGCVAVLLLTLVAGVFQYRWINGLSEADRRRRRQAVETTLLNFSGDFRGTLLQLAPFFRPQPRETNDVALEPYLIETTRRWRSNSDRPQLLASLSIGTQSDQGVVFKRLQTGDNRFKVADWPTEFADYRRLMEGRQAGGQPSFFPQGTAFAFFQGRPVLVLPIVTGSPLTPESQRLGGWSFLELDNDYLRHTLLPELVTRHYGTRYQVAVVASRPLSMVYGSEPAVTIESLTEFDAGIALLDANLPEGGQGPPPRPGGQPVLSGLQGLPLAEIRGNRGGKNDPAWLLVVKNKAGSIDELAAFSQRHTLAFSFIILVLSAGSSVMLIFATVRARRLAQQQMEFVAGVSHELRTPLTVIQSTSYNLSQGTIQDPARVQQYGDVIQHEARRLINQIERMLSFAGIQSGRRVYDPQPTNVRELAERSLAEYAVSFADGGWQIEQHFANDLPLVVTDGPALESALKNLFENALKYTARGKWLSVTACAVQGAKGKEVQMTVADRGPGIAPKDLPHIFEPFYRGRSVSGTTSGAGLGLCLVERNLRALGGRVTVQSKPGEGTSFTLHLPVV